MFFVSYGFTIDNIDNNNISLLRTDYYLYCHVSFHKE